MEMTLYEMIDLNLGRVDVLLGMVEAVSVRFTIFLTLVTGYLITAFVAGKQLTRAQMLIASGVFVIAALYMGFEMVVWSTLSVNMLNNIAEHAAAISALQGLPPLEPGALYSAIRYSKYGALLLTMLGLVAPLYFMWSVRHPNAE